MRHSSISLTLDTYGHLLPGAEQDAVQHFARLMSVEMSQAPGTLCDQRDTAANKKIDKETPRNAGKTSKMARKAK